MPPKKQRQGTILKFIKKAESDCTAWIKSTKHYQKTELLKTLVKASVMRRSIESTASQSAKTPSVDTVLRAIPRENLQAVQDFVNQNFSQLLDKFLPRRKGKVKLAIDFHHEAKYGQTLVATGQEFTYIGFCNKKKMQIISCATLAIVEVGNKYQ